MAKRRVAAALFAATFAAGLAGCPGAECEEKNDLVDMSAWAIVAAAADPFDPPADAPFCTGDEIRMEPFGTGGPVALDVDTRAGCGWATLTQPMQADLVAGDLVQSRLFYFSQTAFPDAFADVVLRFGDVDHWRFEVAIPAASKLEAPLLTMDRDVPVGTPVFFHVGNHGDNSWNLLEVSRARKAFCPAGAD